MRIEPEVSGVSVQLLGEFNPALFTPHWFAYNDLLPRELADSAELEASNGSMTFTADWLAFKVDPERLAAATVQAPYSRVCDLLARAFREHLCRHTPLTALGINRDIIFRVGDRSDQDHIAATLAPVQAWEAAQNGARAGVLSQTTIQVELEAGLSSRVSVQVEPYHIGPAGERSVLVSVQDYYDMQRTGADSAGCRRCIGLLARNFDSSLKRSDEIVDSVMALAVGTSDEQATVE